MLGAIGAEFVIGRIYEAAADPLRWSHALEAVADLLDANAMLLVYGNHSTGTLHVIEAIGFNPYALGAYAKNHLHDDELMRESMDGPAGIIVSSGRSFRGKPFFRKKVCKFCVNKTNPDYRDFDNLRRFVPERGKILPRRITGTCAKQVKTPWKAACCIHRTQKDCKNNY